MLRGLATFLIPFKHSFDYPTNVNLNFIIDGIFYIFKSFEINKGTKMETVLLDKALELPPNERVAFAELILASIEYEEEEIRQSWILEVKDRMKAAQKGKAKLLDFEELYNED